MDKHYKAIFFDLYGTLIDVWTEEEADLTFETFFAWLNSQGAQFSTPEEVHNVYSQALAQVQAALPGGKEDLDHEFDVAPVFARILRAGGFGDSQISEKFVARAAWNFRMASNRRMRAFPGAAKLLALLKAWEIPTVLVSNAQTLYTRPELEECGLAHSFTHILISSEQGVRKPGKQFFQRALQLVQCQSQSVLMVGNEELNDIVGAKKVGMDAAYLQTLKPEWGQPYISPTAVMSFAGADYRNLAFFIARCNGLSDEQVAMIDEYLLHN